MNVITMMKSKYTDIHKNTLDIDLFKSIYQKSNIEKLTSPNIHI